MPILSSTSGEVEIPDTYSLPDDFFVGFRVNDETTVVGSMGNRLRLEDPLRSATAIELTTGEEAPVLAIRLLTHTALTGEFPPLELRIGTTRGTNALLENRGAPTAFFTSPGFADLLTIGDQRRPDLFALQHRRRPPLQQATVEHSDLQQTLTEAKDLLARGISSAAIALKNSYLDSAEEDALAEGLQRIGFEHVSISSRLAPMIKLLPRAQTAVVDAYLAPILSRFVGNITTPLSGDGSTAHDQQRRPGNCGRLPCQGQPTQRSSRWRQRGDRRCSGGWILQNHRVSIWAGRAPTSRGPAGSQLTSSSNGSATPTCCRLRFRSKLSRPEVARFVA